VAQLTAAGFFFGLIALLIGLVGRWLMMLSLVLLIAGGVSVALEKQKAGSVVAAFEAGKTLICHTKVDNEQLVSKAEGWRIAGDDYFVRENTRILANFCRIKE